MKDKDYPKCFGKKNGYLLKCSEAHHTNNCELIEKCYQEYIKKALKFLTIADQRETLP